MSITLSNCEITSISDALAGTRDLPCDIQRDSNKVQGSLGYEAGDGYQTIAHVNVGMALPSANVLSTYANQIGAQATWQVRFPLGQDVQQDDHLIVAGQTLTVQVDLTPRSFAFETIVLASQIKGQVSDGG